MLAKLKSAVKARNDLLVQQILQNKPRLNSQEGGEILWQAVVDDEVEIASMLVRAGADLNVPKPGCILKRTFLHVLAGSLDPRDHRLAVLMLNYGADVHTRDVHTNGVLHYAIRAHHSAIGFIEELLTRGCHVTHDVIAIAVEHPLAKELLPLLIVANKADDDTRKERIFAALHHSSFYHGNEGEILSVVKMLLDMKIPMDISRNSHLLFNAIQTNKIQMAKLLIAQGFDVLVKQKTGYTPLNAACSVNPSLDMIKLLVVHGADFNSTGSDGTTLFCRLWQICDDDIVQFAIKQLAVSIVKQVKINEMDLHWMKRFPGLERFYEQCQEELKLMKLRTFFNDTTFFSIFSDGLKYLSFMTRNDKFKHSYKDTLQRSDFPIFYDELNYVYKAAEERRNMLLQKEEALCEKLEKVVPYLPLEQIVYNFYMNEN